MENLPVLISFEVQLSEQIVKDLSTPGKTFKKDLVQDSSHSDGPVDLSADSTVDVPATENAQSPYSIQLEKLNETVIKLFITVYKSMSIDSVQQTDRPAQLLESSVQTFVDSVDVVTQTSVKGQHDSVVQTEEMRLHQSFHNSSSETDFNMSTQVDGSVTAVAPSENTFSQTELKTANRRVQTERRDVEIGIQTDALPIGETEVQTDSSMSRLADGQTQVLLETSDRHQQTELESRETECQTDMSIARQKDGGVQASVESASHVTQTEVESEEMTSQTDMSMSLQVDCETQHVVDVVDLSCQTELSQDEAFSQTMISMSLQSEQETQASAPETSASFMQTDISQSLQSDQEVQTTEVDSGITSSQDSIFVDGQSFASSNPSDGPFTDGNNTPRKRPRTDIDSMMKDGVAQTDPVTIIIGDASFLVKKLKSSAISPSKVTTTGNEIEIELSAELAGVEAPFEMEEKENDLQRYATGLHVESPVLPPRAGPQIRGGIHSGPGGVMMRQGSGVRVRMPMSTGQSPMATRGASPRALHPGPPVRFQSPGGGRGRPQAPVVRVPTPTRQARSGGGSQASSGSTFSCPFCSLIFIDSPALYEHLSVNHQGDQKSKWKQPKGREGKTIVLRKPRSPPVLTPIEPVAAQSQTTPGSGDAAYEEDDQSHEAGLFEDPVEPTVKRQRKGRQSRGKNSDDVSDDDDEPLASVGVKQRKKGGAATKRGRAEEKWSDLDEDDEPAQEEEEEEPVPVKVSRRGGRTPRGRAK